MKLLGLLLLFFAVGVLLLMTGCFSTVSPVSPPEPPKDPGTPTHIIPAPDQPAIPVPESEPEVKPGQIVPDPPVEPKSEPVVAHPLPPVVPIPDSPATATPQTPLTKADPLVHITASTDLPLGIIGESEVIHLPGFSVPFEARVDTGATTSSIEATDVSSFERDGRKWVRFRVLSRSGAEEKTYELPVARTVRIKQHAGSESLLRISVLLTFRIGHLTLEREFTLTDRSHFEYPVLIGRNIISGLAAVDPSRRNVL